MTISICKLASNAEFNSFIEMNGSIVMPDLLKKKFISFSHETDLNSQRLSDIVNRWLYWYRI